jgi:hypothetical protein
LNYFSGFTEDIDLKINQTNRIHQLASFILTIAILTTGALGCQQVFADEAWNNKMRRLAAVLMETLPLTATEKEFNDPKNRLAIEQAANELSLITKELEKATATKGAEKDLHLQDPLFAVLAKGLAEDSVTIKQLLPTKDRSYAQHLLRTSTSYCTTCHTRAQSQTSFKFPVFPDSLKSLSVLERMKLYIAARQFDIALQIFDAYLITQEIEKIEPLELERSAKLALAVAIRVENTPDHALSITKKLASAKNATPAFKRDVAAWESGLKKIRSATMSAASELEQAKVLLANAEKPGSLESSHENDIAVLRASALLHSFIGSNSRNSQVAEALFLLGKSYEKMESLGFWSTGEIYFEACIRKSPHTSLARQCFEHYRESVVTGYTGSSGTRIPPNVCSQLKTLARLSTFTGQKNATSDNCP